MDAVFFFFSFGFSALSFFFVTEDVLMGGVEVEWRRCSGVGFSFAFPWKEKEQRMKFCSKFASTRVHLALHKRNKNKKNPNKKHQRTIAGID